MRDVITRFGSMIYSINIKSHFNQNQSMVCCQSSYPYKRLQVIHLKVVTKVEILERCWYLSARYRKPSGTKNRQVCLKQLCFLVLSVNCTFKIIFGHLSSERCFQICHKWYKSEYIELKIWQISKFTWRFSVPARYLFFFCSMLFDVFFFTCFIDNISEC